MAQSAQLDVRERPETGLAVCFSANAYSSGSAVEAEMRSAGNATGRPVVRAAGDAVGRCYAECCQRAPVSAGNGPWRVCGLEVDIPLSTDAKTAPQGAVRVKAVGQLRHSPPCRRGGQCCLFLEHGLFSCPLVALLATALDLEAVE